MITGANIGNNKFQQTVFLEERMKQSKPRTFVVTKAYAEDGRLPEVNHYTEHELLNEPIHPFIKECIRHDDFDHFQIACFTHETTIQRAD